MTSVRQIAGPEGPLETLLDTPSGAGAIRAAAVFAHPHPLHGGTMHTKVVYRSAKTLARLGCEVLRFNFRGVGRSAGRFGEGVGEQDDFRAALDFMAERHPGLPLWAAGMSFGSHVALSAGADDARVSVLLGIAPPLDRYDFSSAAASGKPKHLVHGERDEICPLAIVRQRFAAWSDPKQLIVIPGAVHLFTGRERHVSEAVASLFSGV